jgi:N-acetylneuraminic acid mutarotase
MALIRKDFWEYDPATNTWKQKADFGGGVRSVAVGFSIADKGYIGTGWDDSYKKDFWEYDPTTNTWTQKADFGGTKLAMVLLVSASLIKDTSEQERWFFPLYEGLLGI